ncbi:response regulator [Leucothrix arctica]|uniref:Two-component system response regulator n=1 Tax=Leucothrix arctica TaxID=1481894 RepID=A0A317C4M2_9GAMM|nr:response regulator [Leucothrix arctica]PWQ93595.1 two-component system response regulator [Leucothrix arctica]
MNAVDNIPVQNDNFIKILIADDSKTERAHLRQVLLSGGYEVITADSGQAALELMDAETPDLVLLDIIMENGDGYQTCRKLKRNPMTKDIPVVMVTSKSNEVDRKWAMKLGASDYITKPYNDDELLLRLSAL